jgi:uncharacterized membrane protein YdcZ (DUF606 family)
MYKKIMSQALQTIFFTSAISAVYLQIAIFASHNTENIDYSKQAQQYILLQGMCGSIVLFFGSSFLGASLNFFSDE